MDAEAIKDLFAELGTVTVRRLFGGAGIYADGAMIAIAFGGEVYLKADQRTIAAFAAEGAHPFAYSTKDGTRTLASYWSLPPRLYDDPAELAEWAKNAQTASPAAKSRRRTKRSSPAR